jgi:5'-deoxynucleotidase YfbR-like HD superfamily hydrolase
MNRDLRFLLPRSGKTTLGQVFDEGLFTLEDLAMLLNWEKRWSGQMGQSCNVANHSLTMYHQMVKDECPPVDCLYALLHDIEEAFFKDRSSSIKKIVPETQTEKDLKLELLKHVLEKIKLKQKTLKDINYELVKTYDIAVCELEIRTFKDHAHKIYGIPVEALESLYSDAKQDAKFIFTVHFTTQSFSYFVETLTEAAKRLPCKYKLS